MRHSATFALTVNPEHVRDFCYTTWVKAKLILLVIILTVVVIVFGIVAGLTACASVQGWSVCLDYFTRALSTIL